MSAARRLQNLFVACPIPPHMEKWGKPQPTTTTTTTTTTNTTATTTAARVSYSLYYYLEKVFTTLKNLSFRGEAKQSWIDDGNNTIDGSQLPHCQI